MSKTKIVVIHLKEIIYTALFAGLGILLIILLVIMFLNKKEDTTSTMSENLYVPGVYTSSMILNDTALNLEVVVDENHINSIRMVDVDDSITTMFPLIEPTLETLADELCNGIDIGSIEVSEDSKYTQTLLLDTIKTTLDKAKVANVE